MKVRMNRNVKIVLDLRNVGYALNTEEGIRIGGIASLNIYHSSVSGSPFFKSVNRQDFDNIQGFGIAHIEDDQGNLYNIVGESMRFFNIHDALDKILTVTEVDYGNIPDE